jgi:hypothetical protein
MLRNQAWLLAIAALLIAGCAAPAAQPTIVPTLALPTRTPPPSATPIVTASEIPGTPEGRPAPRLTSARNDLFSGSGACAACHTNLIDESGNDVSIDSNWRSTIMANSARDPYWQASVRAEVERTPQQAAEIQQTCARCHMPMAHVSAQASGASVQVLDDGLLNPDNGLHELAMDGVSCSLCHQIRAEGLGLPASYSGGFSIDTNTPAGQRLAYGPYTVDDRQSQIMQGGSGFIPKQGAQTGDSELCATCHMLYTPITDASGAASGEFPEQVPYLEWYYSDYRSSSTCQSCHMPEAGGGVKISATSDTLRSPFARHATVGGNAFMLGILKANADELGVTASEAPLDATVAETIRQIKNDTASIKITDLKATASRLTAEVAIENKAGHKFPTGFPARRAWLHFTVTDAQGQVVFESGAANADGSIAGNANDADNLQFEPHYEAIVSQDQVQIYEAIMGDGSGGVTTGLMRAASYLKDNRLLPSGFQKAAPYADIAVRGRAADDANFQGGGDQIQYSVDISGFQGPFKVAVELLYQSVGFRWAENLRQLPGPEIERFLGYVQAANNSPLTVASDSATTSP